MAQRLELIEQPRLAEPRLRHHRDHLSPSGFGGGQRALHLIQLRAAPDESRKSAAGRGLQPRAQRSQARRLENVDRFADALYLRRTERLEGEESLAQFLGGFADRDRSGRCQHLQPRRKVRGVTNRCVLVVPVGGLNRSQHALAGVYAHADLDRRPPTLTQRSGIAMELVLHLERGIERALWMILMGEWRAEKREDSVARRLHDEPS